MPFIKILGDNYYSGVKKGEIKLNITSTGIPFNIPRYNKVPFKLFGNGRYGESYQVKVKPKRPRPSLRGLVKTQDPMGISKPVTRGPMQIPKIVRRNRYCKPLRIRRN